MCNDCIYKSRWRRRNKNSIPRWSAKFIWLCVICATLALFGFGSLAMCWCYVIFHFIARRQRSKSLNSGAKKKLWMKKNYCNNIDHMDIFLLGSGRTCRFALTQINSWVMRRRIYFSRIEFYVQFPSKMLIVCSIAACQYMQARVYVQYKFFIIDMIRCFVIV